MHVHLGIFLITFSGLIFEVGLTRIYSATIWYHFTFVIVSVALLGWGLGGFVLHLLKRRVTSSIDRAAGFTLAYACSIPLCLALIVRFPFTPERFTMYFVAPLVPFLLAGMALAMVFDLRRETAGSLYFADLAGASLGAGVVTLLLQSLGGEAALLVASVAPFVAAWCLSRRPVLRLTAAAGAVVAAALALSNESTGLFRITPGSWKAMHRQMAELPDARVAHTGWNAYSRIDAVEGFPAPNLARLYIDADAWTSAHQWDGRLESVANLRDTYRALPFKLTPGGETLIIGPGGGADVLAALASGSRRVTAVELNPPMVRFVRESGARAGNLYTRPDVDVVLGEGRNFISRTDRRFDVIFLGFVDTWASVNSGGLSLSENYLYTTEAFRAYYDHLTDDGVLVILRWPTDTPRLVSNAIALLGVDEAARRIVALNERREGVRDNEAQMLFMLRKRPFTDAETSAIVNDWTIARPVLVPGRHAEAPYDDLLAGRKTLEQYVAESPRRVGPVFDDSPFYFAVEKPWGMATRIAKALLTVVVPVLVLLGLFVLLGKPRGQPAGAYAASVGYFACLGLGFITVELVLLQNLTLLLGHPIFTLSILLFSLLLAGGFGSAMSRYVRGRRACLIVTALGMIWAVALPRLVPALLPLPLAARVAIAILIILPIGLAMGIPFPRGLRRAGRGALPAPPFYWGLNGVMSVIGSVATVALALMVGFQAAMIAGSGCYALAAAFAWVIDE
jgi:predicted membrane-bound spermidine synthase